MKHSYGHSLQTVVSPEEVLELSSIEEEQEPLPCPRIELTLSEQPDGDSLPSYISLAEVET